MPLFATIVDSIQNNFPALVQYKYLFLLIATTIEGFNTIILAGFLASLGSVAIIPAVIVCVIGDFLNGWMWYLIGYFGGAKPIDKWGRKDPKSRKIIETVERYFHRYSGRAIVFTKLTWSLTIATMIMAGSFKYNFRKFSYYNFIGGLGSRLLWDMFSGRAIARLLSLIISVTLRFSWPAPLSSSMYSK